MQKRFGREREEDLEAAYIINTSSRKGNKRSFNKLVRIVHVSWIEFNVETTEIWQF